MRKLIAIIIASSVFGGVVGALATAASQSQADPTAIAAAVVKVQDQRAESTLAGIQTNVSTLASKVQLLDHVFNGSSGSPLYAIERNLQLICENTSSSSLNGLLTCSAPALQVANTRRR